MDEPYRSSFRTFLTTLYGAPVVNALSDEQVQKTLFIIEAAYITMCEANGTRVQWGPLPVRLSEIMRRHLGPDYRLPHRS